MGDLPKFETNQLMKPTQGDIRQLTLPGGGSLSLKLWSGMRVKAFTVKKLLKQGAQSSPHCARALSDLEKFADSEDSHAEHAMQTQTKREGLMIRCEIYLLVDAFQRGQPTEFDFTNLLTQLGNMANKALQQGKKKAREDYESRIAEALIGGAGAAHKIVSRDSALPPPTPLLQTESQRGNNVHHRSHQGR